MQRRAPLQSFHAPLPATRLSLVLAGSSARRHGALGANGACGAPARDHSRITQTAQEEVAHALDPAGCRVVLGAAGFAAAPSERANVFSRLTTACAWTCSR
jgi:hypothetical protein